MRARAKLNPAMLPCFELLTDWSGNVQSHLGSCGEDGWQCSCQHRASMTACRTATMALNLVLLGLGFERESFLLTPWALGLLMAGTSLHFGECIHSEHRIFSSMGFASFSTLKANFFCCFLTFCIFD